MLLHQTCPLNPFPSSDRRKSRYTLLARLATVTRESWYSGDWVVIRGTALMGKYSLYMWPPLSLASLLYGFMLEIWHSFRRKVSAVRTKRRTSQLWMENSQLCFMVSHLIYLLSAFPLWARRQVMCPSQQLKSSKQWWAQIPSISALGHWHWGHYLCFVNPLQAHHEKRWRLCICF